MSSFGDDTPILIRTKLQPPRLGRDLIARPHLIQRLNQGMERKFSLISAQAGAGKSTLLAQWLEAYPHASAWLSLDEHDNDLTVFASYLCAAIQTVFPDAGAAVLALLNAPQTPPPRIITTALVNELDALCSNVRHSDDDHHRQLGLVVALDDYHSIQEPAIHEFLSTLITYLPHCVHLTLSTRTDPPFPLAGLRARKEMTELRTRDLLFSTEEAGVLLEKTIGRKLSDETINLLENKTEGWVVGLRLAALSVRDLPTARPFAQRFEGMSSSIVVEYLVGEVLSRQSPAHQDFLLRTSILNRFNAELCDAVCKPVDEPIPGHSPSSSVSSQAILAELQNANLFLIPIDQEGWWFRYHHLFRDLLRYRLKRQHDPEMIATLHSRASRWFEQNGYIDESLTHALSAGQLDRAVQIVSRQRAALMNRAQWQRLDRTLRRFPAEFANQQPELLMLKSWLLYHQSHHQQLPAVLEQLETTLEQSALPPESIRHLKGEISALKSLLYYYQTNVEQTMVEAKYSIENTQPELWIVRILARLFLAGAYQMRGDLNHAYATIYRGADEEAVESNAFKATMLVSACNIYWVAADLQGLMETANQCLQLYDYPHSAEIKGFAHYNLGRVHYHRNDLAAAEENFALVAKQPYMNYGDSLTHSAFGLSLTYLAQNRPDEAREVVSTASAYLLETGNTTLLLLAKAFQAELDLRQGLLQSAERWAAQFKSIPPLSPIVHFYAPNLTLAKIWLALDTAASRRQAAGLLEPLKNYTESTHNTVVLIKVLALLALLRAAEEDETAALTLLEEALQLAQPGGFVRCFLDLGTPMARLLGHLRGSEPFSNYISNILTAFEDDRRSLTDGDGRPAPSAGSQLESLTPREMEVLELLAQRLTNKEIAAKLVISPGTVKTHTLSIYDKLDTHGRRQAVNKARELGLI